VSELHVYIVTDGGPQRRRTAAVKSRSEFGYLWMLVLLFGVRVSVSVCWELRCDRVDAIYHRRVTNKHYDAFAIALQSPLTKRLPTLFHTAITGRPTSAIRYAISFTIVQCIDDARWQSVSLRGFCRNFFPRRRWAVRRQKSMSRHSAPGLLSERLDALSTNWARFRRARGALV